MLELRDVRFAWPRVPRDCIAIDALEVTAGQTLFLHGPSGCGKSTLLSLLAGVLTAREGTVTLAGRSWAAMSGSARDAWRADHVGYLFQQFNLLPWLSATDNVLLPCRFSDRRAARIPEDADQPAPGALRREAERLLDRLGIDPGLRARPVTTLSVGQQQRVAAARALIGRPELLLTDEPTSALDPAARDALMALLAAESADRGTAWICVSHDPSLAPRFDRLLQLPARDR